MSGGVRLLAVLVAESQFNLSTIGTYVHVGPYARLDAVVSVHGPLAGPAQILGYTTLALDSV